MKNIKVGIIGIAGFAKAHLRALDLFNPEEKLFLTAACEVNSAFAENLAEFAKKEIRTYIDCDTMFKGEQGKLDFIIIPTSIQSHKILAISAMKNGFNVLLEKPPAATIQNLDEIIAASVDTGKFCAVSFQLVYTEDFAKIKELIVNNYLGKLKSITGKMSWQRNSDYYSRNKWAGKTKVDDNWIMDGSISNPGAHYLNNMLILGTCGDKNVSLGKINAEFYKANENECEDTVCLNSTLTNGVTVNYYTTLAGGTYHNPVLIFHFENGKIEWEIPEKVTVKKKDSEEYSFCLKDPDMHINQHGIYKNILDHIRNGDEILCDINATRLFMLAVNGAYESAQAVEKIPPEYLIIDKTDKGATSVKIDNINLIIDEAMEKEVLFSDLNVPWSKKRDTFEIRKYCNFPEKYRSLKF